MEQIFISPDRKCPFCEEIIPENEELITKCPNCGMELE